MKSRPTSTFIMMGISLYFLSGCADFWDRAISDDPYVVYSKLYQEPPDKTVWVFQEFKVGKQCDGVRDEAPDTVRGFLNHGIAIFDFFADGPGKVCRACSCPDFIAWHHVLIAERDVPLAADLGFAPE